MPFSKADTNSGSSHTARAYEMKEMYSRIHNRPPPNGFDLWVEFAMEKNCELDLSYYKQIYEDLNPWMNVNSSGLSDYLTKSGLETFQSSLRRFDGSFSDESKLFNSISHLIQYDFEYLINEIDEPVSLPGDDGRVYESVRDVLNSSSCVRNIDNSTLDSHGFFIGPDTFASFNGLVPIISQSKHHCFKDILAPMYYHIYYSNKASPDRIPWNKKKNVLFWRGSTTGGSYREEVPWEKFHRTRLIDWEKKWSKKHPDRMFDAGALPDRVFDAGGLYESFYDMYDEVKFQKSPFMVDIGFSTYLQMDDITEIIFKAHYPLKKPVSFSKALNFKYLLVVDGNTWPSRIQSYLHTNSVILYNGIFFDFYLWMLEPWVHYVPLRTDLSDLEEKMEWLLANDDLARRISENANALMAKVGRYEHLQCYTGLLFQEYGRIFGSLRM